MYDDLKNIWYNNPEILLSNLDQFILKKDLTTIEKINSIARLAVYIILYILSTNKDRTWLIIPIVLLIYSKNIEISEEMMNYDDFKSDCKLNVNDENENDEKENDIIEYNKKNNLLTIQKIEYKNNKDCRKPTIDNPVMNKLPYSNNDNKSACIYNNEIQELIIEKINDDNDEEEETGYTIKYDNITNIDYKSLDPFNKKINERSFISMPVTNNINSQKEFAEWLYGNIGKCKKNSVFMNTCDSLDDVDCCSKDCDNNLTALTINNYDKIY